MTSSSRRSVAVVELIAALPIETQPLVRRLRKAAPDAGVTLHLVGGPVRDWLLGRDIRDVDLLVESAAPPESDGASPAQRIAEAVRGTSGRVVTHGRFGTVRLERGGAQVDLASARTEHYKRPGALPDVELATLDEDLSRRDFSVNAMSMALGPGGQTEVHDPLGGLADIEARSLRVLHPRSFHDDPTRALRAARLAHRLEFRLDRGSRAALRDALRDGVFGAVSGDRLRREIHACFEDARLGLDPALALRALEQWHVLSALEPGLCVPRDAIAPIRRLGRFVAQPAWRTGATPMAHAGLSTWLAPLAAGLRRRTLERLAVRGELAARVAGFPALRDRLRPQIRAARGRGAVDVLLAPLSEDVLQALWAWSEPSERRRVVRWAAEDRPRRSLLGGADVVELGLAGPEVGRVLARTRAAYLDGEIANREEALALARELAQPGRSDLAKRQPTRRAKAPRKAPRAGKPKARGKTAGSTAARKTKQAAKGGAKTAEKKATQKTRQKTRKKARRKSGAESRREPVARPPESPAEE